MSVPVTEIRAGNAFEYNKKIYKCVEYSHIKWAQQARARIRAKDIRSGATTELTFNVDEKVERVHVEYRQMQYLYNDGDSYHFMDQENFHQIELTKDQMDGAEKYIKEGFVVSIAFYEEEPIEILLPTSVELTVTETSPGYKGDTVSGGKPATMETGVVVSVPFFINVGDVLKVDTRNSAYIGRA